MNPILLRKSRPSPSVSRGHSMIHPECPIEQTLRSDDAGTRDQLMQEPWSHKNRPDGTLFIADYHGLRLLARSEAALDAAVVPLQRRFEGRLVLDALSVRYAFGVPTLEPYMTVFVTGPERHVPVIQREFLRRRGRITRLDQRGWFILEGEGPLSGLLAYEQWLRDLMQGDPCGVGLRLSRYLPIDDGGPQAA